MLAPSCLDSSLIIYYPSLARMRLWLSKSSEVPLREQLVTQIILGVASNDLKPEERFPSTRDLARRYKIHSNTDLVAAGLDSDVLSFHDARERRWRNGLRSAAFVITDSLMASCLPTGCTARVFHIISEASVAELRNYVELFFRR
jgi:hypothetical protein